MINYIINDPENGKELAKAERLLGGVVKAMQDFEKFNNFDKESSAKVKDLEEVFSKNVSVFREALKHSPDGKIVPMSIQEKIGDDFFTMLRIAGKKCVNIAKVLEEELEDERMLTQLIVSMYLDKCISCITQLFGFESLSDIRKENGEALIVDIVNASMEIATCTYTTLYNLINFEAVVYNVEKETNLLEIAIKCAVQAGIPVYRLDADISIKESQNFVIIGLMNTNFVERTAEELNVEVRNVSSILSNMNIDVDELRELMEVMLEDFDDTPKDNVNPRNVSLDDD
jgi:hypothetical protein